MSVMRAKLVVQSGSIKKENGCVTVRMIAVSDAPFDPDGKSDDNSFARWTPFATLEMTITNPALFDAFHDGQKFYLDFTEATGVNPVK